MWLIRHGESTANVAAAEAERSGAEVIPVDHRDADVPLSALGERQARALGRELARRGDGEDAVRVSLSPYRRAVSTAELAGLAVDDAPRDERLRDRELGVLDRLTRAGVEARHPDEDERRRWQGKYYHRPAGGESWADVQLRLRSLFRDLDEATGEPERLVLVTHDAVVTLTVALHLGWSEPEILDFASGNVVLNASLTRLVRRGGAWELAEFSAVGHLDDDEVTEHAGERESADAPTGASA